MTKRVESITLDNFKGATNKVTIDFDTSKPVVIIFGENGTGKSTIVDAIDFVCNESFGSIDQRSTTGSKADLLASLGSPADNLKVVAKYAGNDWTGIIGHGRKPVSTGSGDRPTVKILEKRGKERGEKRDTSHILINGNRHSPIIPHSEGREIEILEGKG